MTLKNSMEENTEEQLTFFQEDSHASHLVLPGSEKAKKMTASSGKKWIELSQKLNQNGLLLKMFRDYLLSSKDWFSSRCFLTWKVKDTKWNRLIFRLLPSMPPTKDTESGLLPTVTVNGNYNRKGLSKTSGDGLITAINAVLPTPRACDLEGGTVKNAELNGQSFSRKNKGGTRYGIKLKDAISLLPTPTLNTSKNLSERINWDMREKKYHLDDVFMKQIGIKTGLRLQPNFVEWMMGFPLNWTDIRSPKQNTEAKE